MLAEAAHFKARVLEPFAMLAEAAHFKAHVRKADHVTSTSASDVRTNSNDHSTDNASNIAASTQGCLSTAHPPPHPRSAHG